MNTKTYELSSFPQEFFSIWEEAQKGTLALPLESKGQGVHLRQKLYTFRKQLAKEIPEMAAPFLSLSLIVEKREESFFLSSKIPLWKSYLKNKEDEKESAFSSLNQTEESLKDIPEQQELSSTLAKLGFSSGVK